MTFEISETSLSGIKIIKPEVYRDERGFFMETYVKKDFKDADIDNDFIQDNHSKSERNVLRGLHYQKGKYAQAKLVRCTKGKIMDVAVDLRKNSDTFGEYLSVDLSKENNKMLFIPRGFAHGFLTLSETAEIQYKVDNKYAPHHETGIIWNDPELDINWPTENPKLSNKDKEWPTLEGAEEQENLF